MGILTRRVRFQVLAVLMGVVFLLAGAVVGLAVGIVDADGFDIDGNLADENTLDDWESVINATGGIPITPYFGPGVISDDIYSIGGLSDATHFKGGNKFLDPASWRVITKNGGSAQNDFGNVYIVANQDGGDPILYVGFERLKKEGDFHLDVEINKGDPVNGAPVRTTGDFAVVVDILKAPTSGQDLHLEVIRFTSPTAFVSEVDIDQAGADLQTLYDTEGVVALMNQDNETGSFNHDVLDGNRNWDPNKSVGEFTFTEMAIDLSKLGIESGCPGFAWVHLKSRASDATNADLKDLVGPVPLDLSTCGTKTFQLTATPMGIDGVEYYAVYDHTPSSPGDVGEIGDLGSGEIQLSDEDDDGTFDYLFDTVAPGTLDFHFEARRADGTVILASDTETETIGENEDVVNPATFDYLLTIDDDSINEVDASHEFVATLVGEICGTDGTADAANPSASGTNSCSDGSLGGIDVHFDVNFSDTETGTSVTPASSPAATDASGELKITVNSSSAQIATVTVWVDGEDGDAGVLDKGEATDDAVKTWVDAQVSISGTATNEVGDEHTFTVTVKKDVGDGAGLVDAVTADLTDLTYTLTDSGASAVLDAAKSTCDDSALVGGECVIVFTSDDAGTTTGHVSVSLDLGAAGGDVTRTDGSKTPGQGDAVKTWVDARISIGDDGTNGVGEPHTFTGHVTINDGGGWDDAPSGTTISFAIDSGPGSLSAGSCVTTDASGTCSVDLTSAVAGVTVVSASTNVTVGALPLARTTDGQAGNSGPATKTWVAGSLEWFKHDETGSPLGGATFQVCRTHDRFGTDITDECVTVLDDSAPDVATPLAGKFKLVNLKLGRYSVEETLPPAGYIGDPTVVDDIELTTGQPDHTVSYVWINRRAGQITHTGTTCYDFIGGTAEDLTSVEYRTKSGLINNSAPGVFFYYTKVTAPSPSFTVDIEQTVDQGGELYEFHVQNLSQIRFFNADCSTPDASWTPSFVGGDSTVAVSGATAGDVFVISVKYETGSIVGLAEPSPTTVHYDFSTMIGGGIVDADGDGIDLTKKGGN